MLSANQIAGFLKQQYLKNEAFNWPDFLHADANSGKKKDDLKIFGWAWSKMDAGNQIAVLTAISQERSVQLS